MSKKRKAGVPSNTAKLRSAYTAHKKALRKEKAPPTVTPAKKQNQHPPPPFEKTDRVLLVGEGDFSFALSLRLSLGVRNITATCFDAEDALLQKYPQAAANIAAFLAASPAAPTKDDEEDYDLESEGGERGEKKGEEEEEEYKVHYGIDATKLLKRRMFSKSSRRYDRIAFQFPHVGGTTKDQARQVRYNQELLLGFLRSAMVLLTPDTGAVVVTLFEGLPYELWNIRALAKEAGLLVKTSFVFDAADFPGYRHVRTLGNIEGGGGWKGEDRKARTYIFGLEPAWTVQNRKRMDRKGSENDDD